MTITLIILFITSSLFLWGKFRSDLVSILALIALTVSGVLSTEEALAGFSNPIVLMLAGLFVISGAVSQTGLAQTLSTKLLQTAGNNELKLFILTMIVAAILGSFMSNAGTATLLLPIVFSMTREANLSARRFLMPMAFAASMGGMMTLIGTPPVLIVSTTLIEYGYPELGFFTVLPIGIILLVVGLFFLWNSSKILTRNEKKQSSGYGDAKSPTQLIREYQLADNLFRIKMNANSPMVGRELKELNITQAYNISIIEIRRTSQGTSSIFLKSVQHELAEADTILNNEDIIYVAGAFADVKRFTEENNLKLIDTTQEEVSKDNIIKDMKFNDIGVAEAVVLSSSKLINKEVKDSGFRNKYGVNILGIKRKSTYIFNKVQHEKIQSGDSLLIQGTWSNIDELDNEESNLVVIGKPTEEATKVTIAHKATTVTVLLVAMVISIVLKLLEPVVAISAAAALMILLGCFKNIESAYNSIRWQTVIFFAAMIPMATAMNKTGAFEIITDVLISTFDGFGPHVLLAAFYFATLLITSFVSNATSAILFAPIAIQTAQEMSLSPYPFLFAVATASVMCLASPYGSSTNSIVMSPGGYSFGDFIKVGLPLQIIYMILMVFVLPLLFPF